jgi:DNA cross-link repair 1A protein
MATDIAGDVETNPPLPVPDDLDDNGFPTAAAAASSTFADDFYRSGVDWSSLQAPPRHQRETASGVDAKGGGSLVQRSLFQAWGIEKPPPREEAAQGGSLRQRSLFQAWGIQKPTREEAAQGVRARSGTSSPSPSGAWSGRKRRRGGEEEKENGAPRKPIACPFYKKIPGKARSCTLDWDYRCTFSSLINCSNGVFS